MNPNNVRQSILPFSDLPLTQLRYSLKTKPKSLVFGRRLYQFTFNQQRYWLKTQIKHGGHQTHLESFQHELNMYGIFAQHPSSQALLLNYQMLEPNNLCIENEQVEQLLIIEHAVGLFEQAAEQMSLEQLRHILWLAMDAIEKIYAAGYLHADLKREHFVIQQGQCKLIDFEQSLEIEHQSRLMTATPRYMAPELFQGQAKSIQSEIYALGIIFLEWLTAKRLQAANYQDWAYLHCQRLRIDLPEQFRVFQPLLMLMLDKQKQQRMVDFYRLKRALMTEFA